MSIGGCFNKPLPKETTAPAPAVISAEKSQSPRKVCIFSAQSPGDTFLHSVIGASLRLQYGDEFQVDQQGVWDWIFRDNPHLTRLDRRDPEVITIKNPGTNWGESRKRLIAFPQLMCEHVGSVLGKPDFRMQVDRPVIFLTDEEKQNRLPVLRDIGPYVVITNGYKLDKPCKAPGSYVMQGIVDALKHRVTFVQIGEAVNDGGHVHRPLEGVLNLIGKTQTPPRDVYKLFYHSVAAIGNISMGMHCCAGMSKSYICYGGGIEQPSFNPWPSVTWLSTVGMMDCCKPSSWSASGACWSEQVEFSEKRPGDRICKLPVIQPDGQKVPACHAKIGARGGVEALSRILDCAGI